MGRSSELEALIAKATDENLTDGGRYFAGSCDDLTKCSHSETGNYVHDADGDLVEFLWNHRADILKALQLMDEGDDGPCTDCEDTGVTIQTERKCSCGAGEGT